MKEEEQTSEISSVPEVVNLDEKTIVTSAASSACSVQNDRLTAFLQILFSKANYDRNGELSSLVPESLSNDL